jgi:alpha-glucosidase
MADFGYDVADYQNIHPLFGDLEAFDRLLAEAHKRGLRVILDYVPNHSSDQHPWFLESRSSRVNPKADWYIWRDPSPEGGPPNNWQALFGGPAWEWDEARGQYYLHLFLKEQPDLNWDNPDLKAAMLEVLHFWLKRGVDGFRMDVVTFCCKHPAFPDNPALKPNPAGWGDYDHRYDINQPEVHHLLKDFRALFEAYPGDRVTIGETWFEDPRELASYYGQNLDELHMPFNFQLIPLPWEAGQMRRVIEAYYAALPPGAQPNFVLGNHDKDRPATRYGYINHRAAAMLLLTLWGTPTLYYGDELGMENIQVAPEDQQDPYGRRVPGEGRDGERSPMQWEGGENAGFCPPGVKPWLPLASNAGERNVLRQALDEGSTLSFYKRLIALRRALPALHLPGDFRFLDGLPESVLAYRRQVEGQNLLVAINFGEEALLLNLGTGTAERLLSTERTAEGQPVDLGSALLLGHEACLFKLG